MQRFCQSQWNKNGTRLNFPTELAKPGKTTINKELITCLIIMILKINGKIFMHSGKNLNEQFKSHLTKL